MFTTSLFPRTSLKATDSEAVANGNYHQKIKSILTANGDGPNKPANSTVIASASKPSATSAKSKSDSSHDSNNTESSNSDKAATKDSTSGDSKDKQAASRVSSRFFRAD